MIDFVLIAPKSIMNWLSIVIDENNWTRFIIHCCNLVFNNHIVRQSEIHIRH